MTRRACVHFAKGSIGIEKRSKYEYEARKGAKRKETILSAKGLLADAYH